MVPVMMEMTKRKIKMFPILRSGNGRQTVANPSVWSEKAQMMRRRIRRQSIGVRMVLTRNKERIVIPELEGEHRIFIIYLNPPHEFTGE
jgi:hypothetical protein